MTKAATIDKRRILHIVVIAAMMVATLLAAMTPTLVSAADNGADNVGSVERRVQPEQQRASCEQRHTLRA